MNKGMHGGVGNVYGIHVISRKLEGIVCSVDTSPRIRSEKFQFLLPSNSVRVTSNGGID